MPRINVRIELTVDDVRVPGFPVVRTAYVDEALHFDYDRTVGGGFVAVPCAEVDEVEAMLLMASKPITVRLNAQSDAGFVLNEHGLLIMLNGLLDSGLATNVMIDNSGTEVARVRGLVAGT